MDQCIEASEALRDGDLLALMPAGCRCPRCGQRRMITSPEPLRCADCAVDMTLPADADWPGL
jgi:uncharacterized protein (DUF983 family)